MAEWDLAEAMRLIDEASTVGWLQGFEPGPWRVFEAACLEAVRAEDLGAVRCACEEYRAAMSRVQKSWSRK